MEILTFDQIDPVLRFAQQHDFSKFTDYSTSRAYDNRLFYCISGKGRIVISGKQYKMHRGSLILWKNTLAYNYREVKDSNFELIGFNFDFTRRSADRITPIKPAIAPQFEEEKITEDIIFSDAVAFNTPLLLHDMQGLENEFIKIKETYTYNKKYSRMRCSSLLKNLLAEIALESESVNSQRGEKETADQIMRYIHENFDKDLKNVTLSKIFGYHSAYIGRLMLKATGMPTHQYVLECRINRAIDCLQTGSSVSETAYACGFHDIAHFSKSFKNKVGISPSEYILNV